MALLALQDASEGASVTFAAAAAGGDTIPGGTKAAGWDRPVVLVVKNGSVSAMTVTVADHPQVSVPASGEAVIPVNGGVYAGAIKAITYSAVTSVTVAAVSLAS